MSTIATHTIKTTIGELVMGVYEGQLCMLDYRYRKMRVAIDRRISLGLKASIEERDDPLFAEVTAQVEAYLMGEREQFDLPTLWVGSDFQQLVWQALMQIPYGRTMSYADLAHKLQCPKAIRSVANANGANALALIVPCHRVIGSDGKLTGYAGGIGIKKRLLGLESSQMFFAGM